MSTASRHRQTYADLVGDIEDDIRIPRLAGRIAILVAVILSPFVVLIAAYHFGAIQLVGKAWAYDGEPTAPGSSAGIVIGSRHFFALKGSRLYLDYNTQINSGHVVIGIADGVPTDTGTQKRQTDLQHSSCGRIEFTAERSGWHHVYFRQSAINPGQSIADLSFTARWGYL